MARVNTGYIDMGYHQEGDPDIDAPVWLGDAKPDDVLTVLTADDVDEHGRSQWLWVRFPNGDLMLATFPQGATYEAVSDTATPGA